MQRVLGQIEAGQAAVSGSDETQLVQITAAVDVESRMCAFSRAAMDGMAYKETRRLALRLRSWRKLAEISRPVEYTRQSENNITAVRISDWDYRIVMQALLDLHTYLQDRERVARRLSAQAGTLKSNYNNLVGKYGVFKYNIRQAEFAAKQSCPAIIARKWVKAGKSCETYTQTSLLLGGHNMSDPGRSYSYAAMHYLKASSDMWENYAKHLDDGLSLLAFPAKWTRDITAEGIPARLSHLQESFDGLATKAEHSAQVFEDAHLRKYTVEVDLGVARPDDDGMIPSWPPEPIGCALCDGAREAEWYSSSSSASSLWPWTAEPTTKPATQTATRYLS
jgi:hypothetical protein